MNRKIIFIVDDDDSIRETLTFAFKHYGYEVFSAANGREALEMLHSVPRPTIILLDLMMPIMGGGEFANSIEGDPLLADIPIFVLTAAVDKADLLKGVAGVIKKPLDLNGLLATCDKYCAHGGAN
jgi:CheY-like chemotaxis protein